MDFPELEELISFMRSCYSPTNYNYIHFKVTRWELNSSAPVHTLSEAFNLVLIPKQCGQAYICPNL